jgi:hypothetical protein
MTIRVELTGKVEKIRKQLLGLMKDANRIKSSIGSLAHDEVSLRSAISITLDDLERVDAQIRGMGATVPTGEGEGGDGGAGGEPGGEAA